QTRGSDLLFLDVPLLAGKNVGPDHQQQQHAADTPDLQGIRVCTQYAFADPVDDDPGHQGDASQDFVKLQMPVPADDEVSGAKNDEAADGTAPDVEGM